MTINFDLYNSREREMVANLIKMVNDNQNVSDIIQTVKRGPGRPRKVSTAVEDILPTIKHVEVLERKAPKKAKRYISGRGSNVLPKDKTIVLYANKDSAIATAGSANDVYKVRPVKHGEEGNVIDDDRYPVMFFINKERSIENKNLARRRYCEICRRSYNEWDNTIECRVSCSGLVRQRIVKKPYSSRKG